jgi:exopolysaccharide production protein ExoZ
LLLITLTWLVAMITNLVEPAETASLASFYANPILFEFAAGCLIGHMIRQPSVIAFVRVTPMWPFALAGLAGFAILPAILSLDAPSVLRYGAPSVLLVFAAVGQDLYRAPARESWLTKLGDASYSAYLLHPVLLVITTQGVRAIVGDGALSSTVILAGVLISTACASLLCVRYFEKPVTLWLRNLGGRQAPAVNH